MRANGRKYDMGKRFATLIGLAATGAMALGAQTGAATEGFTYESKVTIDGSVSRTHGLRLSGSVESGGECVYRRRVIVFKQRPGADRKLGTTRTYFRKGRIHSSSWLMQDAGEEGQLPSWVEGSGSKVYAKVPREVGDGFVCLADRSKNIVA
jgi:hypothetical protein